MNKMKKILLLTTCAFVLLGTTACSSKDNADNGADQTNLRKNEILNILIPVPSIEEQQRIVNILDRFDTLCNDLSEGLPAEIEARRKQYEYYRDKLLSFEELQKK